jgi:phasin
MHKIDIIPVYGIAVLIEGNPTVKPTSTLPGTRLPGGAHHFLNLQKGPHRMTQADPFSASVIPFEVPEQMRAFAEKGVSQARDNYAKFKDAAETHNGTIEAVFTSASKGASAYSAKLMEFMKANTTANLDFAQELFSAKSPTEAMELWTGHTRKQWEALGGQAKELVELVQKVATETAEPIKASASKYYKPAA